MSGNGSDLLRGSGHGTAARQPVRRAPSGTGGGRKAAPELVGRDRQVADATALLDRLRAGRGGALVVSGTPGTGKSALLEHLCGLLDTEVRVLAVPGDDDGTAYAWLHQLLRPVRTFRHRLPPAQQTLLARAADPSEAAGLDPFPLALAALNLLAEAAARRPLVMVVDDLDRLDHAGFTALGFVARRLASEPVVLLGAMAESSRHRGEALGLPVLTLDRLDGPDATRLVDLRAPGLPSGLREHVLTEAEGNPRALDRLAREAQRAILRRGLHSTWPYSAGPEPATGFPREPKSRSSNPAGARLPHPQAGAGTVPAGASGDDDAAALVALARRMADAGENDLALRVLSSAAVRVFWIEGSPDAGQRIAALCTALSGVHEPRLLAVLAATSPVNHGALVADRLRHWADHPGGDRDCDLLLASAALMSGAPELAASFSATAVPTLRLKGNPGPLARALTLQAMSAALRCDLPTAAMTAAEAVRLSQETGQPLLYASARAAQALAAALGGRAERTRTAIGEPEEEATAAAVGGSAAEAQARAEETADLAAALGARPALAAATAALAHLAAARHDTAAALGHLLRLHGPASAAFHPVLSPYWLIDLADAALLAHRGDEALSVMDRMARDAAVTPSRALHIGVRFARAVLADDADAEPLFADALAADLTRLPFARARTQLAHGEWLRRRRRDAQARTPLRAARDAFDALGARSLADRARGELRASGEASAEHTPNVRELLNPQELQIALMVAEGLTNREIGERLYLSHRTVSGHLHRIFPRLGVASRAALGRLLRASEVTG
ncbi:LuxR family transcriptional regulator [Streptomyces sp. S.PB5]|uniref:helix-turn-helix transcriptional regulator n=1 Tax=Streptomyces sp. S.PB5 TaxID=3020844 RepID=UPI0025B161B8|nr:LuxR family transcriptional regulator [Streptomyces sp. S.PB5]MDN3028565.1 LuxR family transcriptional regulator [Streptomyces sp. S.PB5]